MSKFEKPKFLDPTKSLEENCNAFVNKIEERAGDKIIYGLIIHLAQSAISMAYALYAKNEPEKFNEMTILEFCNPVVFITKYRLLSTQYFTDKSNDEELKKILELPSKFLISCDYSANAETNKRCEQIFENLAAPVRDFILGKESKILD